MEMELKIPREDFESLIELLNLSDSEFDSIVKDIEKIPVDFNFQSVESELKNITSSYKVILGLYFTFCKFDMHEKKFAKQLANYYKQMTDDDSVDSKLETRIQELFKKDNPIRISIKSRTLFTEASHVYNDSRVLSDIRPIFASKEEDSIIGKIVLNNLKITYRKGDDYKDFFVTLDDKDLIELRDVIDRAIKKTEILKSSNL